MRVGVLFTGVFLLGFATAVYADTIPLPRDDWSVVAVSSDNTTHPATHAIDNDTVTWWALYNAAGYSLPGEIILDLGGEHDVTGFSYLPNAKSPLTKADSFAVWVSDDPARWGQPAVRGIFDWLDPQEVDRRTILFGAVRGRFVKVMYLTNVDPRSDNVHTCDLILFESSDSPAVYKRNQYISLPHIPEQYTRDGFVVLHPIASSGLPVEVEKVAGPVTIRHDTVFFDGQEGVATIRAKVAGNDTLYPQQVVRRFRIVDLTRFFPVIHTPLTEDEPLHMPELLGYPLWFRASIDHEDQLTITSFEVSVDGETVPVTVTGTVAVANWTPASYGIHTVSVTVGADNGNATARDFVVTVDAQASTRTVRGLDHVVINFPRPGRVHYDTLSLPQYLAAYKHLTGHLYITCPDVDGGCDDWDRTAHLEVQNPSGEWVEIIRYITPYGVPCNHTIDLTDYMGLLQGKVPYRLRIDTWGTGGWEVTLDLEYEQGIPDYPYKQVYVLWNRTFPFGDPANLQPVPPVDVPVHRATEALFLDLVTTGHGWGKNNSQNAAEFYHAINYLTVNGKQLTQDLWRQCDPNPDNCTGQLGTWYYPRAGWCPGSIAKLYRYDLSEEKGTDTLHITYTFDPRYKDLCHPHNPDCISGTTCPNCKDGFNPIFTVSANVIACSHFLITDVHSLPDEPSGCPGEIDLEVWPNPVRDQLRFHCEETLEDITLYLMDENGTLHAQYHFGDNVSLSSFHLDVSVLVSGVWYVGVRSKEKSVLKRIIVTK